MTNMEKSFASVFSMISRSEFDGEPNGGCNFFGKCHFRGENASFVIKYAIFEISWKKREFSILCRIQMLSVE